MKKLSIIWGTILAFLLATMGAIHSIDKGKCVKHTHTIELDGYIITLIVYFVCMATAYAVYKYYNAVILRK